MLPAECNFGGQRKKTWEIERNSMHFRLSTKWFLTAAIHKLEGTLEPGIDVAPWINVASKKFDKTNKRSPLKCANL